jgi:purine-binding chemotaxis protein CheW
MTNGDPEMQRILRARATAMAAPPPAEPVRDVLELIVFRVGEAHYAIEAIEAAEAIVLGDVTPLPGLPPFYCGLIAHEGIVYPLIDIRPLVGEPPEATLMPAQAILFRSNDRAVAVAAESVESFVRIDAATIGTSPSTEGRASPAVRGVTDDGTVLLEIHVLLADARLVIDQRA